MRIKLALTIALAGAAVALLALRPTATVRAEGGGKITSANWGEMVGFKPDLAGAPKKGTTITASNLDSFKEWVPQGIDILVKDYKLKLKLTDYEPIHPSVGYIAATNTYLGKPNLVDVGGDPRKLSIRDYTAGLPFPQPKSGVEVAYNYHYGYFGDDGGYHYGVYWIDAERGVERWEEWRWLYIIRAMHRTDLDPMPKIPDLAEKGIQYTSMTWAIQPQDKRGFAALYSRMLEPKDQQGWIYLPPTRRTLRMSFGTRGDAWNQTDLLYEDVRGFMGYPEWMNWKIVGKVTALAPMHADVPKGKEALEKAFDFKSWPHWNPRLKWEPRPLYVVEATPRLADYPYSKMVFYFDAETFYIPVKVCYDKKGELWKVLINAFNDSQDMDSKPLDIGTAVVIDLQSKHATAFPSYNVESNIGVDPGKFTLSNLKRMGR